MSDYFFYDMNKKMADLAKRQQLAEDAQAAPAKPTPSALRTQLNERDLGKHNNATTGFAALAKKTGGGEKGARIAGAQLAKMRAKGQVEEEVDESAFQAAIGKKKYGDQGMKALQKAGRDHAGAKTMSNIRNKYDKYDKGMTDEGNAFSGAVVKAKRDGIQPGEKINVGGKTYPVKENHDAKTLLAKYSPDMHDRIKNATDDQLYSMAQGFGGDQHSRVDHELDQLHKVRHHLSGPEGAGARRVKGVQDRFDKVMRRKSALGLDEVDATPQHVDDWTPPAKPATKASAPKPPVTPKPGPKKPAMYPPQAIDDPVKEGSVPMTPKQKKFAALAKPFDKITFADKIVGAKKEVDEMLGDVAADAMKKAVGSRGQSSYQRGQQQDDEFASDHFARARNQRRHDAEDEWARSKGRKPHADMDESWIDDEPTRRRSSSGGEIDTSKPGVTRHTAVKGNYSGARHDVGMDDEPSGAVGRRKVGAGMGKKIGAKINRGTSKLMTKEGDMPEDMIEPHDSGEYDREGEMAKDDIKTVVRHAQALEKILGDEDNLPEWVQSKLAKIEGMMTAVDDYMQNQKSGDMEMDEESTNKRDNRAERAGRKVAKDIEYDEREKDGIHGKRRGSEDSKAERAGRKVTKDIEWDEKHKKNESSDQHFDKGYYDSIDAAKKDNPKSIVKARKQPFEEESTNTRDSRAERAGRKVAKDIEYDEKEKDGIHGQRRSSEDNRAEQAGKKVTKDIEYDEKKNKKKKKEVDETTSSGSVATGAAPKSSGGHNYGKGIYDSLNRQLENMISESMTVNMTMNNDDHGGPKKSLTVTATDEDAVMLAGILKMAGMGNGDDHIHDMTDNDSQMLAIQTMGDEEPCSSCGSSPCGCDDEMMDEDRWGAEQPPKLPYDMSVTAPGGVDVSKAGNGYVYKDKLPGGRITATIPASASNKMFPNTNVDEAYGDTDATENEPDWPTNQEGTDNAMMYSGGIDGPKSTGQTTIPVISGQHDRMGHHGDHELRRMMEIAGLR